MKKLTITVAMLLLYTNIYAQKDTLNSEKNSEIEEVILKSTRTSRTIANTPTRVETIELEEIDEKSNMRPSNVAMILHESTGIAVQQTSATSGSASIRMQGMDGRYTQILKDGFPSFGNFANGLSILEIPPIDLKQVEIIKGPSSTLYGAGAIAGVINFISREPNNNQNLDIITNFAYTKLMNFGVFAAKKYKNFGYTFTALYSDQKPFDVDKDDFSELPDSEDFTIHPKLFLYLNSGKIIIGNSFTTGDRTGGDMQYLKNNFRQEHPYFEANKTVRNTTTFEFENKLMDNSAINLRASYALFKRKLSLPNYFFEGKNHNFYSDFSWSKNFESHSLILGANYTNDAFRDQNRSLENLSFNTETSGGYIQHTWDISNLLKVENGIRADFVRYGNSIYTKNESFFLPKTSFLFRFNNKWTSRIGGGLGYKTPTAFTEQSESFFFRNLQPLNNVVSEKSIGATADVNFRTKISDDFEFSINQMFFYTRLKNAIILNSVAASLPSLSNAIEPLASQGFETNIKLIYNDFLKFFGGYTYTDTRAEYFALSQKVPLVPKNRVNLALVAEKESNYKVGLEAYYTDSQYLYDSTKTPAYWELGFMAEKYFGKFSVFINLENFTDTRQSRYKPVVSGSHSNPIFDEIWTHTEGRTINGGIKFKL